MPETPGVLLPGDGTRVQLVSVTRLHRIVACPKQQQHHEDSTFAGYGRSALTETSSSSFGEVPQSSSEEGFYAFLRHFSHSVRVDVSVFFFQPSSAQSCECSRARVWR